MLAIDARETAPASATQQMYQNNTGDYTGIAQFIIIVRIIIFCVVDTKTRCRLGLTRVG